MVVVCILIILCCVFGLCGNGIGIMNDVVVLFKLVSIEWVRM